MKNANQEESKGNRPKSNGKLMIYFHGNAEDVGHNLDLFATLRERFNVSVLGVEYPGYGFFCN